MYDSTILFLIRPSQESQEQQPQPLRQQQRRRQRRHSFGLKSSSSSSSNSESSSEMETTTTVPTTERLVAGEEKLVEVVKEEEEDKKKKNDKYDDKNKNNKQPSLVTIASLTNELEQIKAEFDTRLAATTVETVAHAEAIRREYLGKKGPLNHIMGQMRVLSSTDKPKLGLVVNQIKAQMEHDMTRKLQDLQLFNIQRQMELDRIDVTQPGLIRQAHWTGRRHPLGMTMEKALDVFVQLGYDTVTDVKDSPEIETDYYCFEALNCPKDHPARDMQDTFYLTKDRERLLRTHTSAVQIRQLEQRKPPLRIVAPGRVFRKDDIDATHSLCFHQVEILALEEKGELTLGHLKGTVEYFLQQMFGPNIQVRFRGSYFPFTEPSMEVDVYFRNKWLEVLGCGMVDPAVLEKAGIDPNEYGGFAAGFGVERFAMVMHEITDLRELYKNDYRFLQQFPHFYDDGTLCLYIYVYVCMYMNIMCMIAGERFHFLTLCLYTYISVATYIYIIHSHCFCFFLDCFVMVSFVGCRHCRGCRFFSLLELFYTHKQTNRTYFLLERRTRRSRTRRERHSRDRGSLCQQYGRTQAIASSTTTTTVVNVNGGYYFKQKRRDVVQEKGQ